MSYLVLPPELILVIALVCKHLKIGGISAKILQYLTQGDLNSWSLVNKFTQKAILRARYRSLVVTPRNASSYLRGAKDDPQYLTYVKELQMDCRERKEVGDIRKCLQLAQMIPAQQLTRLQWQLGNGTSTIDIQDSTIFLRQGTLRSLILYPWPDNQPYPQGLPTLTGIGELKLCTFGSLGAACVNTIDTGRILAAKSNIQSLHISQPNGAYRPPRIKGDRWQQLFRGFSQVPGLQLKLKEIRLDHCTFKDPDHLPWEFINCGEVQTLAFQTCLDISPDLRVFSGVSLLPWSLKSLKVTFWDNCMDQAPEQLQCLENFLRDDRICNLTNLHVEVPNGQRLLSSGVVACHSKLHSLTINVTDGNGWLLVYTPEEIGDILSSCDRLQDLSCTIPAIEDQGFYVS